MALFGRGLPVSLDFLDINSFLENVQARAIDGTVVPVFIDYSNQRVGIGTITPDASSKMDITSTKGGLLLPRMTMAQRDAISSPAAGLMIFNTTDNQFEGYNGTSWIILG